MSELELLTEINESLNWIEFGVGVLIPIAACLLFVVFLKGR